MGVMSSKNVSLGPVRILSARPGMAVLPLPILVAEVFGVRGGDIAFDLFLKPVSTFKEAPGRLVGEPGLFSKDCILFVQRCHTGGTNVRRG